MERNIPIYIYIYIYPWHGKKQTSFVCVLYFVFLMRSFSDFKPQHILLVSPRNFYLPEKESYMLPLPLFWQATVLVTIGVPQKWMIHTDTSWPMRKYSIFLFVYPKYPKITEPGGSFPFPNCLEDHSTNRKWLNTPIIKPPFSGVTPFINGTFHKWGIKSWMLWKILWKNDWFQGTPMT